MPFYGHCYRGNLPDNLQDKLQTIPKMPYVISNDASTHENMLYTMCIGEMQTEFAIAIQENQIR